MRKTSKNSKTIKENTMSSDELGLGDAVHIKSQNKTGMYYGEENGKIKVKTPSGMELASEDDIEVIPDDDDFMEESSLNTIIGDIEQRLLEDDELNENMLKKAALATMLGLGTYAGLEATSMDNTPLGQAMQDAAQQGDEYAERELDKLDLYIDAGDTRMIRKLSNKYLGPVEDRTMNEATSRQSDLDPEKKVVVKGVKGMNSKSFTKTFRNMKSAEKWMDDNEGDVEIKQIENEDSVAEAKHKDRTMNETKLTEGIIDRLRNIVDDRQMSRITFDNGETLEVDMQTANAIVSLYNAVNDKNKAKIEDNIGKKEMFQKFADFAFQQSNNNTNEDEITEKDEDDPCWDGYEQYGTKMQDGEEVPNCVPVNEGSLTEEETLLAAMKDSTVAESAGMTPEEARNALRNTYGYDDLAIARAQLDETTSAGSVAAVSAPVGDTKKRSIFGEEEADSKDSEFDSAWFYKSVDGEVEGPYKSEKEATDAANNYADWVKQGSELEEGDRRLAKRAFLMKSSVAESKTVSELEKKFRSQLNEAKVKTPVDAAKKLERASKNFGGSDKRALKKYADMLKKDGYNAIPSIEKDKRGKDTIIRDEVDSVFADLQDSLLTQNEELNEAMDINVSVDPTQPESRSISVTASEQEADELAGLLSNAGLFSSPGYGEVQFQEPTDNPDLMHTQAHDMPMEEDSDYSNSPEEKYQDMEYMLDVVSGGLNREKNSYDKAEDGDNPMDVVKEEFSKLLDEKANADKEEAVEIISKSISMKPSVVKAALKDGGLDPVAVVTALKGRKTIKAKQLSDFVMGHSFGGSVDKKDLASIKKASDKAFRSMKEEEDTAVGTMDEFYSYVLDFYGPNGIYDIGATEEEVKKATELVKNEVGDDFEGDSVDREKVRDVILDQMRSEEEREEAEKAFRSSEEVDYDKINDMMSDVPDPIQTRGDVDDMDRMRNFNETDEVKRLAGLV